MENSTSEKGRDFKCTLCPSSFRRKDVLTSHIRSHVREKGFECNQCTYKTGRSSSLGRHLKAVHERHTPFECSFPGCNYRAAHNQNLQRHCLTHVPDQSVRRPFQCTFEGCDYSATRKSHLGRHVQSRHNRNREKRFECSMCSAAFYSQRNLQAHVNEIHVKELMHSCNKCEYKSSHAGNVKEHMRRRHGDGRTEVIQKRSAHQSAKSTQRRRQETNPNNGTKLTSSDELAPVPRPAGTKHKMKTAGKSKLQDALGNSLSIFTCTLCNFIANNEQQALEHSAFYKDHVLLPK